ncbi:MAG: DUF2520 domain-containing protein [Candidatus Berkiella sp.]
MRQVPFVKYLVIGSGRMATHFCHYLSLLHLPFTCWSRAKHSESSLQEWLPEASHILVLISDSAIPSFIKRWQPTADNKVWIHFSGQLTLSNVISAHPLSTFSKHLYDLDAYQSIHFVTAGHTLPFSQLLPGLPNPSHTISVEFKTFYHAMCVISGNFTSLVWTKFFKELKETFQIPHEVAIPYLKQIMNNIIDDPKHCLTGPLVRGDQNTIRSHLNALEDDEFLPIYEAVLHFFNNKDTV